MARMTGAGAFLRLLADEGVTHLFGNPGTTELPIMAELGSVPELTYVLGLQEAVVMTMAEGFSRATGKLSSANVHVAPGLGNAMGGLYSAKFVGAPVILSAGQQAQGHGLLEPILAGDLVEMARPQTKWAVEVTRHEDLARIVRRAAKIALAPPTGPVFISLPTDLLETEGDVGEFWKPVRVDARNRPSDSTLEELAAALLKARNPVIIVGQEIALRDAFGEAVALAETMGAAVYQMTMPSAAAYPSDHPTHMGPLGRMQKGVRAALEPYDLLVFLGSDLLRMSLHNSLSPLPDDVPVIHISERSWELGKNYRTDFAINADVGETVRALLPVLKRKAGSDYPGQAAKRIEAMKPANWSALREKAAVEAMAASGSKPIDMRYLALRIAEALPHDAVVVNESGPGVSDPLMKFLTMRNKNSFYGLSSGALGFGAPGAVGVSIGLPDRPTVAVIGDGSTMYGPQCFWTAAHFKLPLTFIVVNNRSYDVLKGRLRPMVGNKPMIGMDLLDPMIDFVALGRSMGLKASLITDPADIDTAVREGIASGKPNLIEVQIVK